MVKQVALLAWALGVGLLVAPGCETAGPANVVDGGLTADGAIAADAAALLPDGGRLADASVIVVADATVGPILLDRPAIACADLADAVYLTPAGLPAMSPARRGDVVRCAGDGTLDLPTVQRELGNAGAGSAAVAAAAPVTVWHIAYRTTRGDGSAGVTTARVYLPTGPHSAGVPLVVVGHPSTGIANRRAPSLDPAQLRDLALPWAALGYPTIAPDFAGLGNEGVHAYLDNRDAGQAMLDGARALRRLLGAGLGGDILMVGYSQGGGAALSAQALERSYGTEGHLAGVIGFAPEWPTRENAFGYLDMLKNPGGLTIFTGVSKSAIAVLRQYAWFGATRGRPTPATASRPPSAAPSSPRSRASA